MDIRKLVIIASDSVVNKIDDPARKQTKRRFLYLWELA